MKRVHYSRLHEALCEKKNTALWGASRLSGAIVSSSFRLAVATHVALYSFCFSDSTFYPSD
jgi:hypothetical protein